METAFLFTPSLQNTMCMLQWLQIKDLHSNVDSKVQGPNLAPLLFNVFINDLLDHVECSARVGKTCLVARFLGAKFQESYTPTIEDFHRKLYRIRGEIHQLDLLDTSGNHPFPAMRRLSFLTGKLT
ncbi:hypothetical protein Trydic_g15855 [Trypoxylus dichotomus]